jgi:acyl-coenzyme A thioesterase PaaI-like protein
MASTMRTDGSMPVPFPEHVGVRVLSPGTAEVDLVRFTTQGAGSLQGGIVALVAEVAAESLTASPILDLDVRYLNAVRVGPGRATATRVGRDLVRVEVRDGGSNERLAALVMARVAPPR